MVYHFVASDLDGTLLDANHTVDAFTAQTLQALQARGVQFAIATGRHYLDVQGIRQALGIRAHLITSNGARVHDPDDALIYRRNLDPALVRRLAQPEFAAGTVLNFYTDDAWLIDQPCPELAAYHQDSGLMYQVEDLAGHGGEGVGKVLYLGEHDYLLDVERRILQAMGDGVYVTFSADSCLEVMAPGVSKGDALDYVLQRLGVEREHCLAFGDGQNDVELLQTAGHPRVMANAQPRLKQALPDVPRIGSNHQAGVARHLRELFAM